MSGKLVITQKENVIYYGYFVDGNPVELYCEPSSQDSLVGNIYAARVEKVAEGIGGAFLEISDGNKCYYPIKKNNKPVKLSPGHEDKLYGGDIILVQVTKDAVKTKLAVADDNVSITGKYFVFTLADHRVSVSQKIKEAEERKRLKAMAQAHKGEAYGIIVRTNAREMEESELERELSLLQCQCEELLRKAKFVTGRSLLYKEPNHYITLSRELPKDKLDEIVTDSELIFSELEAFYRLSGDEDGLGKCRLYKDSYSLYSLYRMGHFYEEALGRLVWLKSGGNIVIEQTEALTVIDVNTASVLKGKKHQEEIVYQLNCEAAVEIAKQIRLRNLSGIILIDFINLSDPKLEKKLIQKLEGACQQDRVKTRVIDITALGLVEMTRTKKKRPLHEQWKQCKA